MVLGLEKRGERREPRFPRGWCAGLPGEPSRLEGLKSTRRAFSVKDTLTSTREVLPKESSHVLIEFRVKSGSVKARWINANDSGIG